MDTQDKIQNDIMLIRLMEAALLELFTYIYLNLQVNTCGFGLKKNLHEGLSIVNHTAITHKLSNKSNGWKLTSVESVQPTLHQSSQHRAHTHQHWFTNEAHTCELVLPFSQNGPIRPMRVPPRDNPFQNFARVARPSLPFIVADWKLTCIIPISCGCCSDEENEERGREGKG